MDRVPFNAKMARLILENGNRTKNMEKDNIVGQMEIDTKDNISAIKGKVLAQWSTKMDKSTKVIGWII